MEFHKSSIYKIVKMIEYWGEEEKMKAAAYEGKEYTPKQYEKPVRTVQSLKSIPGIN